MPSGVRYESVAISGLEDQGHMLLTYNDGAQHSIIIPHVTKCEPEINNNVGITPVPSLPAANSLAVHKTSSLSYSVSFYRISPMSPSPGEDDSTYTAMTSGTSEQQNWSNAKFADVLREMVDRWQVSTNGFKLTYYPIYGNNNLAYNFVNVNVVIKRLTLSVSDDDPSKLTGSMSIGIGNAINESNDYDFGQNVQDGTVHSATAEQGEYEKKQEMKLIYDTDQIDTTEKPSIFLSSFRNDVYYRIWMGSYSGLQSDSSSCLTSMDVMAGPNQQFEKTVIKLSKKKMMESCPELLEPNAILAGKNRILYNMMGNSVMIVSRVSQTDDEIIITAYTVYECLKSVNLGDDFIDLCDITADRISTTNPYTAFVDIISALKLPKSSASAFNSSNIVTNIYENDFDSSWNGFIQFHDGDNVLYLLNVLAICMNAKLFFADGKVYLIDYTRKNATNMPVMYNGLDFYKKRLSGGIGSVDARDYLIGKPKMSDNGTSVIQNYIKLTYTDVVGNSSTESELLVTDSGSMEEYGVYTGNNLDVRCLTQVKIGTFASNYIQYYLDPQQSISMEIKEFDKPSSGGLSWKQAFYNTSVADHITIPDYNYYISNESLARSLVTSDMINEIDSTAVSLDEYLEQIWPGIEYIQDGASVDITGMILSNNRSLVASVTPNCGLTITPASGITAKGYTSAPVRDGMIATSCLIPGTIDNSISIMSIFDDYKFKYVGYGGPNNSFEFQFPSYIEETSESYMYYSWVESIIGVFSDDSETVIYTANSSNLSGSTAFQYNNNYMANFDNIGTHTIHPATSNFRFYDITGKLVNLNDFAKLKISYRSMEHYLPYDSIDYLDVITYTFQLVEVYKDSHDNFVPVQMGGSLSGILDCINNDISSVSFTIVDYNDSDIGTSQNYDGLIMNVVELRNVSYRTYTFTVVDSGSMVAEKQRYQPLLMLSAWERHYPEFSTMYKWGEIAPVSLSQMSSEIGLRFNQR